VIQIWVDAGGIAGGEPIYARTSHGTYRAGLLELHDAKGALVATIRYSRKKLPGTLSRVWIEVEDDAQVTITDRRLQL